MKEKTKILFVKFVDMENMWETTLYPEKENYAERP